MEQIQVGELDVPKIGPNEVLIEAKFAALNHLDIFLVRGWPGLNLSMPHVLNPIIDKVYPLEQVKEAEKYLSEGKQFGKVLLEIS